MEHHQQFTCFIIGEGTLPIQCAEILLQCDHTIHGVISPDAAAHDWAQANDIPYLEPTADLIAFMSQQPFDYLFSIVNWHILPEEILRLPRQDTINYHDAPLPRYAGTHATSWAIMQRETSHAVTWHIVADLVDAGDILKQRSLTIAPDETAFTLNAKCYDAAISSFAELVDELSSGGVSKYPQDLSQRTYFPLYKRPAAGAIFSWNQEAGDIHAFVRALDFGTYPNPLGLPKIALEGDFIIVPEIDVLDSMSETPAGTITSIEADSIKVSTTSYELALHKALTIDGQPLSIPDVIAGFSLCEGYRFKDIAQDTARRITELNEAICKHESFWVERLANLRPISLPYTHRIVPPAVRLTERQNLSRQQYARVPLSIPEEATTFLEGRQAWSTGDFLFAVFVVYLARIGGTTCFDVGFRGTNLQRDLTGLEQLFASHVPLRVDISFEQSFAEVFDLLQKEEALVRQRRTYIRDAVARYPTLHGGRIDGHPPAYSIIIDKEVALADDEPLPGTELTMVIAADGARSASCWLYDPEILAEDSIERMQRQFTTLLRGITRDPNRRIANLPLLSDEERHHLLVALAQSDFSGVDYPRHLCLHERFEAQVERTPEAVAVRFVDEQLTYRELNERANQVAHYLQARGVRPEMLVGIYVERSLEMIVGLLGILKAGGAYLPLDPAHPKERLAFMLEDAQVSVLLTQEQLREALPEHKVEIVCLDSDWETITQQGTENPISPVTPDNLAYVIYTSGSTGRPKGVQICHRSVVHLLETTRPLFHFNEDDIWTVFHSYAFDFSVWEIWTPLVCGSQLIVVPLQVTQSPAEFYDLLRTEQITVLNQTPSAMRQLIYARKKSPSKNLALRLIICGGEAFPREMLPQLLEWNVSTWNFYGPTEATVWVAINQADTTNTQEEAIPIGRPLPDTQLYVLDEHLQPVPIGVPGELYIGGIGLARGYFNRPGLTAEKFIPNPFTPSSPPTSGGGKGRAEARLYKTGDLVRYLPDGTIGLLGRIDHQVKIRGFRVELGEVETILSQHPAVREAVVIARKDISGQPRLVAYVIPQQYPPSATDLRTFLQGKLPDYMVPTAFVTLDALPLTPNKKLDRRALPAPGRTRPTLSSEFVPPRTTVEELLVGIWSDVLDLEQIGIHDNLFELGGHSLLATQIISRLRDMFQVELPLASLFEAPTVSALVQTLTHLREASVDIPPIRPTPPDINLPLSFAQQRLWFLYQLDPDGPAYNVPAAIRLRGPLNVTALAQSLNQIVVRHAALRTTFSVSDGEPLQVITPTLALSLPIIDLRHLPEPERKAQVRHLATEEARKPFDLAHGPLIRTTLLHLDEQDYILLLTVHHIISDGWSRKIVFQDLSTFYHAFITGQPAALPDLPLQYADFAFWQRQWLVRQESETFPLSEQLAYWQRQLANLSTLQLPTDRPHPPAQTFCGATYNFSLPPHLVDSLQMLSRQEGVTLFMTLFSAFQTLLHRYSGQTDIPVGSPVANRNRSDIENLIGFFVNTVVLRADLSGNPSFRTLLKRIRQVTLEAHANQDLPFDQLVEILQPERDPSRQPFFQVMFSLQNEPPLQVLNLPDITASWLTVETGAAQFDLSLEIIEETDELSGIFEYNTDLFDPSTIARMTRHFETLLVAIIADPDQRLSDLPLLTESEQEQMLVEWNLSSMSYVPQCLHAMFEAQVERTPEAIAVLAPAETDEQEMEPLTYRELNQRANQLAHHLQKQGVAPEIMVGFCVERSPEMIVGLLGILKAGGAYVPLDPEYPQERLAFMLTDTQAPVLLTHSKLMDRLPQMEKTKMVCLDTDWDTIAQENAENLTSSTTPKNLAYVMYTSGSTGVPKGVMIEHHSLAWYAQTATAMYGLTARDRILQFASFSFDVSVEEIYPCLTCGGTLVLRTESILGSMPGFLAACQQWGITALFLPTAFWHELAASLTVEPQRLPSSLRLISFGGEKVLPERITAWQQIIGARVQLMNGYGPTETTVVATLCQLSHPDGTADAWQPASIGRRISGTQVYILDQHLQPVPIGVPGELHIGGEGVARGYLHHPELTQEKFIPNPFPPSIPPSGGDERGGRLYKTGDLARYRPDGSIEYLGRFDQQVKIRGFRVELAEIEAILTQHSLVRDAAVAIQIDSDNHNRLVAYIVLDQPATLDLQHNLYRFLKTKLPNYMLPATFVTLTTLPLTPNGKVDRQALPSVDFSNTEFKTDIVAPRNRIEKILADIWGQVLGLEQVGVYDNFFALGGDSILSIQIIARANQAGLRLTPRQIFEHQTIVELAKVVDTATVVEAEQGMIIGPVPLTPIQHWFFAQNFSASHHWHMPVLLEVESSIDSSLLTQALRLLAQHHDALRLRFMPNESAGGWQQFNAGFDENTDPIWLTETNLAELSPTEQDAAIQTMAADLQANFNLSAGPLWRAALFYRGPEQSARLLWVAHHLVVDGVSWRILLEDLQTVYQQLSQGQAIRLPPKTTSFKQWAEQLNQYAQSDKLREEADYWLKAIPQQVARLPLDYTEYSANTEASARVAPVSLDAATTRVLLHTVATAYRVQINQILLTALVKTLAQWIEANGEVTNPLLIDLEGHGREEIVDGVVLSRTVGWFTTLFPVHLSLDKDMPTAQAIKLVQEALSNIPQRGIGYGLLRYLSREADITNQLQAQPQAEVSFNYLGQFETVQPTDTFRLLPLSMTRSLVGPAHGPANQRTHLLEVDGYIAEGQLHVNWTYSERVHQHITIENLATNLIEILRTLISACQCDHPQRYTPADFPLAQLDQQILASLTTDNQVVEDIYPLSPLQHDMLWHAQRISNSRAYYVQWFCTLHGDLDIAAFRHAWQHVVERHPILRTAFVWQDLTEPLQFVHQQASVSWAQQDWQGLPPAEQEKKLADLLAEDRSRGFDLARPPLMRLTLIQTGDDTYEFVWSHHHLLLDGWSTRPLWQEIFAFYNASRRGDTSPPVSPPLPYHDYISWLQQQQVEEGHARITLPAKTDEDDTYTEQQIWLPAVTTIRLQVFAQQHHLTLNSVVQGAWALLLRHYTGQKSVKFWTVVSDRPVAAEFETMVGLLIKTSSVQIDVSPDAALITWLTQLQQYQAELRQQRHVSPYQSQEESTPHPQFESILRFQNYPLSPVLSASHTGPKTMNGVEIRNVRWIDRWPYPLNLEIIPGEELWLRLSYQQHYFDEEAIQQLLSRFSTLFAAFLKDEQISIGRLLDRTRIDR